MGADFQTLLLRWRWTRLHQIWREQRTTSYFGTDMLLRFEMKVDQRQVVSKIEAKFHFLTHVKLGEGWGRMLSGVIELTRPNLWYTFDGRCCAV